MRFHTLIDLLLGLLDPILFSRNADELFSHPLFLWVHNNRGWRYPAGICLVMTPVAWYYVALIVLPLYSPFWRFMAHLIFRP